jgi:hypothetical protein
MTIKNNNYDTAGNGADKKRSEAEDHRRGSVMTRKKLEEK